MTTRSVVVVRKLIVLCSFTQLKVATFYLKFYGCTITFVYYVWQLMLDM